MAMLASLASARAHAGPLMDYIREYDLNDYALGLAFSSSQNPYVGTSRSSFVYPYLTSFTHSAFTRNWLLIRGENVGFRVVTDKQWEFGLVGRVQTLGPGSDDIEELVGIDQKAWAVEAGPLIGWRGWPGRGYALGVGEVKLTGMVRPDRKMLTYKVDFTKAIQTRRLTMGVADGRVEADGETIYMVKDMKVGAVIVDLASEGGGNCELTRPGETVDYQGRVTIHGPLNVPSELPVHASEMYAKNLFNLVSPFITEDGGLELDFEDEVIAGCVLTYGGEVKAEQYK